MKFQELLRIVGDSPIFKTSVLLTGQPSADVIRRQLDRWVKANKIAMLRRGTYVVMEPYAVTHPHQFSVANALRNASYVSLQSALAYYGMIPEYTPVTMSITTGRPEILANSMGRFIFRHVKKSLFCGFGVREITPGQLSLIATPDKALVDLLYLTPYSDQPAYLEELRVTPGSQLELVQLDETAEMCKSKKVLRAVKQLRELWKSESEYVAL